MASYRLRRASKTDMTKMVAAGRRAVRRLCGAKTKVDIVFVPQKKIKGYYGMAIKTGPKTYRVELADWMNTDLAFAYLIHEIGHVVHWHRGNKGCTAPHGSMYGEAWAATYRAMVGVK